MEAPFRSYLKNRTHQDLYRETAPCCLRAADRQCTAFGLDVSWPFYDHRLVELMFQVPGRLKIREGVTKHLLREAMRGIVPEETRTRIKKTGWNAPAHVWFCEAGRELVLDLLSSRAFRERGIYHPARVRELLDEHQAVVSEGRPVDNHMMFLWQLVNLELWLRRHDSLPPAPAILRRRALTLPSPADGRGQSRSEGAGLAVRRTVESTARCDDSLNGCPLPLAGRVRVRGAAPRTLGARQGGSQPRVDRLALQRQHAEHALVDAAQRLAADEALERLDAERELAQGQRALARRGRAARRRSRLLGQRCTPGRR